MTQTGKLPLYRQVRFKLTASIIGVLVLSLFLSYQFDKRFTRQEVERLISSQFSNTANITENFINFFGQSGLMAARSLAEDPQLQKLLSLENRTELKRYFSTALDRIAADTAILLDPEGNILAVSGYPENSGNLRSLHLVSESLKTGQPDFSIVQDMGTFILFSSAPVLIQAGEKKQHGLILAGYALNNTFVDNLKKSTNIDMAIVRERSIIAGTLQHNGSRLTLLPIPFTEYQMILKSPDGIFEAEINGKPYYIKASRLQAMQKNMAGSLLLAYSQQELQKSAAILQRQQLILLSAFLVLIIFILLIISRRFLGPIDQLVKTTGTIDRGDLTARAEVSGNDEIALLGVHFNTMVNGLQEKDKALRNANKGLEIQVASRTDELDEKNRLLDSILFAATDLAIIASDAEQCINYFNPKAEQLFQLNKEDVVGQNISILYSHLSSDKEALETTAHIPEHRQNHSFSFQLDFPDTKKRVEAQLSSLTDKNNRQTGYVLLAKDVSLQHEQETERKMMAEKLQRAQKMEAIGLMAGGIAHDLNNILSGIIAYPELLLMELPQDSPLRKPIQAIHDSGTRAADIVADLLTVARGVAAAKEPLNLNDLILEHLNSPKHQNLLSQHPGISCTNTLSPDIFPVFCSKVHIIKCLLNLLTNGAEAIDQEGVITIATRNQFIENTTNGKQGLKEGNYVVLSITDSGAGISDEDIKRIFDPFYTKKILGRSGTGLGLSVIWNTVEEHNGNITVQSSDQGTCFEMYLPASQDAVQHTITRKTSTEALYGQGEKILIVDDEPLQRDIGDKFLTRLGYHVETVSSGEGAVLYLQEHSADLIILDMKMDPGMNGCQTYEQIIQLIPGQKAIIASGFSEDEVVTKTLQMGAGQFIRKPYSITSLGQAVHQELYGDAQSS